MHARDVFHSSTSVNQAEVTSGLNFRVTQLGDPGDI